MRGPIVRAYQGRARPPRYSSVNDWDRYLLEEGKLNLTIRLLVDFKDMQRGEMFAQVCTEIPEQVGMEDRDAGAREGGRAGGQEEGGRAKEFREVKGHGASVFR